MHWPHNRTLSQSSAPRHYSPHIQQGQTVAHDDRLQARSASSRWSPLGVGNNQPRGGQGGGGGNGRPGQVTYPNSPAQPQPPEPVNPKEKMRDVVKKLKQVINEQKGRLVELRREARKSLNIGDNDSYQLYVDNMVHVRMFMRKITKAVTSVHLIGTNLDINQCNSSITEALADFLKLQGQGSKIDMDEITRNYFDNQMDTEGGIEAFIENMKDLNDPEGVMEEERARERAKIEAEITGKTRITAPQAATGPLLEAQQAREMLKTTL